MTFYVYLEGTGPYNPEMRKNYGSGWFMVFGATPRVEMLLKRLLKEAGYEVSSMPRREKDKYYWSDY